MLISVVIFSAVILALAGLSFRVARRSVRSTDQTLQIAEMLSRLDEATVVAYDSLANVVGCDTTVSGRAKVIGCTSVTSTSARTSDVLLVVYTNVPGSHPDSLKFQRGKLRRAIPLR